MFNSKIKSMVKIVNYQRRETEQGREFFVLEVQGGVEMVKSQETGKFYLTARKALVPSTFDEITCQALIGSDLAGEVEKVACAPYEYVVKETGEVVTLQHRYEYVQEKVATKQETKTAKAESLLEDYKENVPLMANAKAFSSNGSLVH